MLDLNALGGPVEWATGSDPAPAWLDIAREYMERYIHQRQIRDATGRPGLGIPKVPFNPDILDLAVCSDDQGEVVGLRQRETGVHIRVCGVNHILIDLPAVREDDRVHGKRELVVVGEVAEIASRNCLLS